MKKMKLLFLFITVFNIYLTHSQSNTNDNKKAIAVLENYFGLEREAIHIHLDKTTFVNNESVWYQGYILNRRNNKPFFTSNVYVLLLDEKGTQLSEKLIYASNGIFSGKVDLGPKLKSGNYYIQVYTNWMNNFSENEATITKINIINPSERQKNYKKVNPESLEIVLNPEGKNLIRDISNTVGIQVKDCQGNSPENLEAIILNSSGESLKTIKLNRLGFGKFDIVPTNENIKVVVKFNDKTIEKSLPSPDLIGISLAVNSFSLENKTAIKIKTNLASYGVLKSKKLSLIIHQDQKFVIYPLELNPSTLEKALVLDNIDFQKGINTIRIVDNDLKQWSERLIYVNSPVKQKSNILKNHKSKDKIALVGYSGYPNALLSISILPQETKSSNDDNSIISGLTINPYLNEPLAHANYYLSSPSRVKFYELDLALLNQQQLKYNWDLMKITQPTSNYSFDMGISLKGTIDNAIKNKTYHKVKLVSYRDLIMMQSDVTENGEYLFEHLLIGDSAFVNMSLQKLPKFDVVNNLFTPQVLHRKKPFYKPFKTTIPEGCSSAIDDEVSNFDIPKLSLKTIQLNEVKIENDAKTKLVYETKFGNAMLRGFKIDDNYGYRDLLSFLESHSFNVDRTIGQVTIYSRSGSFTGKRPTPEIFIDNIKVSTPDELTLMSMSEIDEIYLDAYATVGGLQNKQGIIKIYRKKNFYSKPKKDPNSFYLAEGFSPYSSFKNAEYESTQSEGFNNFGLIDWLPQIRTDESGQFIFETADYHKPKCKIIIEGMTNEGLLFHEEQTVELQ